MSRTRRSAWNLASTYGLSAVGMVTGLVATPLLLRWLGEERFGALRALTDWQGYVNLLELGVSGAVQPLLAAALAAGVLAETARVVRTAVRAYMRVGALIVAAGNVLAVAAPLVIPVRADLEGELVAAALMNVVGGLILPLAVFRWLAEAGQRGYMVNLMLGVQGLTAAGLALAFARIGWGLPGQTAAALIGLVVLQVGLAWDGMARQPDLARGGWPARDPEQEARFTTLNRPALVFNLCTRLSIYSDSIILSLLLGPAAVVPYYLTQRIILLSAGYVLAVANSTWAALVELHHQGRVADMNRRICQLTLISGVMSGGLLVPVAVANASFVRLWVGADRYGGDWLTVLTVVFAWSQNSVAIWGWVIHGTGNVRRMIPCSLVGAGVNLGVSVLGTWWLGPIGPALGSAVQYGVVMTVWLPLILRGQFGTPVRKVWAAVLRPAIVAIAYALALVLLAEVLPPYRPDSPRWACWLGLAAWLAAAAGGYLILAWFMVLSTDDRRVLTGRIWRRGAA